MAQQLGTCLQLRLWSWDPGSNPTSGSLLFPLPMSLPLSLSLSQSVSLMNKLINVLKNYFKRCIYSWESECKKGGGAEREGEGIGSRLPSKQGAQCGAGSRDPGIMTQARRRHSTDWATQMPQLGFNGTEFVWRRVAVVVVQWCGCI